MGAFECFADPGDHKELDEGLKVDLNFIRSLSFCLPVLAAPARMAAVVLGGDTMGPERIFPNQTEELGPHQGPTEGTGDWSSEEPEEEQEETGAGPAGYSYQPLNQDPEQDEVELAPVGDGEDVVADIQDRIQVWRRRHCSGQVKLGSLKGWP